MPLENQVSAKDLTVSEVDPLIPRMALRSYGRIAFFLFFFLNSIYFLTSSGRVRTPDEYLTVFQSESLVLHGTTAVPQSLTAGNFYGRYDRYQAPRAPYPPGQAFATAPWFLVGHGILSHLPGVPADASDVIVPFAMTSSSATFAALAVAFAFLLLMELGVSLLPALLAVGVVAFATPIFAYSSWFFSEPLTCLLTIAAAFCLFGEREGALFPFLGALALSAAIWVRPTNALAIPVFLVGLIVSGRSDRWKASIFLISFAVLSTSLLLARNQSLFGSWFDFGYPPMANGRELNSFSNPLLVGVIGFLFTPGKSVFLYAPPVILALFGYRSLRRRNPGLAFVSVTMLPLYILFYAKLANWEGGYCFGPRYLVVPVFVCCLALGPLIQDHGRRIYFWIGAVAAAGCSVQFIGMATSFLEDQARRGNYYYSDWSYRMGYSFVGQIGLLLEYTASLTPAALGYGFDRWFVFLFKAGVEPGLLFAIAMPPMALAVWSGYKLWREVNRDVLPS